MEYKQDIVNLKWEMKPTDVRALPGGKLFQGDILQTRSLLTEK